jgi:GAG-pre-integrase domain
VRERYLRVDIEDKSFLWHLRYDHLHHGDLQKLSKKRMVHGLSEIDYIEKFCEECVLGKHLRHSFQKKAEYRTTDHLTLIHTDIYGPITPESFSGKKYSLLLSMTIPERLGFIS